MASPPQPQQPPLFGLLPAGQPLLTTPTLQPSTTSFLYLLTDPTTSGSSSSGSKSFSHLAVFLLPNITLPAGTAAAIYLASNPSAFFSGSSDPETAAAAADFRFLGGIGPGKESAVFKLADTKPNSGGVVIGINIEDAGGVAERIQQLQSQSTTNVSGGGLSTQVLAQRIIQNAFNFCSSFSGQLGPGGVEVVPLKAFQEWWRKFETRIKNDPGFLERSQD